MEKEIQFMEGVTNKDAVIYDSNNPIVWRKFQEYAFLLITTGRKRLSAKLIFERIRWDIATDEIREEEQYKLNNNYTAYYARKFEHVFQAYKDYFEKRKSKTVI